MAIFPSTQMKTEEIESVLLHLKDLNRQSERRHMHVESYFLNEEELEYAMRQFPEGPYARYEGGYPDARKKKVIFPVDEEDDFSDIVCLEAKVDQRFRTISHRDVLGALMSLQIDRHRFGDFWVTDSSVYLYTSEQMGRFLCENLNKIGSLSVSFEVIDAHPAQVFQYREFTAVVASQRADAIVAGITHVSRSKAKEMIRQGLVQINHVPLVDADELCNNNVTISIRGTGRFTFVETLRHTRSDRIVAVFRQAV